MSANYEKFQTRNPVVQRMIDRFYRRLEAVVEPLAPSSVLDAGCGEGETLARLGSLPRQNTTAIDQSEQAVRHVRERIPGVDASVADVADLPFGNDSFDLVLCLEVLEHLPRPDTALDELARVSRVNVVVS